ncbi:MAG: hypothetical protein P4L84_10850 [Isosphaeraceae bacterium]|nr:hypothetical protein [Isosphaeraceae bacterium]
MSVSVTEPISLALARTGKVLFRPFDLAKWMTLGFCAWLANLGSEGSNFGARMPLGGGPGAPAPIAPVPPGNAPPPGQGAAGQGDAEFQAFFQNSVNWVQGNLEVVVGIGVAVVLVLVVVSLLIAWLKARGTFMFLDGVVRDRGAVARPWTEYAREGNSLFRFVFCFGLVISLVMLSIVVGCAAIAWPDMRAGRFGDHAVSALILLVPLGLLVALSSAVIQVLLVDFVVPIMYVRRQPVMAAWNEFGRSILAGHIGTMALYFLLKFVVAACAGLVAVLITCATCCIAALPYVGTVVLLPVYVFQRAFPLYVLEQYGPDWRVFPSAEKPSGLIFDDLPPQVI